MVGAKRHGRKQERKVQGRFEVQIGWGQTGRQQLGPRGRQVWVLSRAEWSAILYKEGEAGSKQDGPGKVVIRSSRMRQMWSEP
jgi:hypothetical protein